MRKPRYICTFALLPSRSATWGGASCISHLAKSLNKCAIHFSLGPRPCIISSFLLQLYLRPKITQLRPCIYVYIYLLSLSPFIYLSILSLSPSYLSNYSSTHIYVLIIPGHLDELAGHSFLVYLEEKARS